MSILSGFKKYKDYIKTSSGYQLASRWTSSDTVEMKNGKTLTNNIDTTLTVSGAFADAKSVGDAIANVAIETDTTLSVSGAAADSKTVGDALAGISTPINSINMYYDPTTDIKYLKNESGTWVAAGRGGLGKKYLIENGIMNTDLVGGLMMVPAYSDISGAARTNTDTNDFTIASDENSIIMAHHQLAGLGNYGVTAFFGKIIDLTDYDYLYMDFSILHEGYDLGGVATSNVVVSSAKAGEPYNALAYAELLACNVEANSGQVFVNVSHLSGTYNVGVELALRASQNEPGRTVTCHAYNMWLE